MRAVYRPDKLGHQHTPREIMVTDLGACVEIHGVRSKPHSSNPTTAAMTKTAKASSIGLTTEQM